VYISVLRRSAKAASVILGDLITRGYPPARGPATVLGGGSSKRESGGLRLAWGPEVDSAVDGDAIALVDGFLLGAVSDARALLNTWNETGSVAAEGLRGTFTVIVWDGRRQRGMIACDHYSSRSCFVHDESGVRLRFSTHLPSLLRLLPAEPEPEPAVIVPWIVPRYLQGRRTMARGVLRLGGAALLEMDGSGWRRRRYWEPRFSSGPPVPREERPALVRDAIHRSIASRMPPDGPTGVILSGGLDSSVVAAVAAAQAPGRVRTYSTLFPHWRHADESERIAATTAHLGVAATTASLKPQGAFRLALEYLRESGTVPGGPGLLVERPLLQRAAADGVRVMLDGQGGDEVFGYSPYVMADFIRRGDLRAAGRLLTHLPDAGRRRPSRRAARMMLVDFGLAPALGRVVPRGLRRTGDLPLPDWLADQARGVFEEAHEPWPWIRPGVPFWWAYQAYLVTLSREGSALGEYTWLRGASLGLESRTPLFDVDLTELMLSLPPDSSWGRRNRPLARAAVEGLLPDAVRLQTRKANIGPFYFDVLTGPDLAPMREILLDPRARVREWVKAEPYERAVRRTPTEWVGDGLAWATVLWRLATAEAWLRWREDPTWVDSMLDRDDLPGVDGTFDT
jgi:asparagine synthase (glutamine-hydrolysing)